MNRVKLLKIIGSLVGIGCLIAWIHHLGFSLILENLARIHFWSIPILLNSFLWYVLYTIAWEHYFRHVLTRVSFLHLLKIKVCGEAVNMSTPLSFMGGDPIRVMMLQKTVGSSTRLGSVILDRLMHSLATVCFVFTGIVFFFFQKVYISAFLRWSLLIGYFLLISLLAWFLVELIQGRAVRVFQPIIDRLGLSKKLPALKDQLTELNDEFSTASDGRNRFLTISFICHFLGRVLGAFEIALIFLALTHSWHWLLSLMLASLTTVIHLLFAFIPGGLGLVESLYGGFFYTYGLHPAMGLTMQLIRRLRSLFWVALGFILLLKTQKKTLSENT